MTSRAGTSGSVAGTRSETFPAVHTTSWLRGSSACSAATRSRVATTASWVAAGRSARTRVMRSPESKQGSGERGIESVEQVAGQSLDGQAGPVGVQPLRMPRHARLLGREGAQLLGGEDLLAQEVAQRPLGARAAVGGVRGEQGH